MRSLKTKVIETAKKLFTTEKGFGTFSMEQILVLTLGVLLFTAVIPTIATNITSAQTNLSGASSTLLGLVTLVIIIVFMSKLAGGSLKGGK